MVLKPSLTLAKPSFAFSFRPQTSEFIAVDMNLSPKEYNADLEEYTVDLHTNVNDNVFSKLSHIHFLCLCMFQNPYKHTISKMRWQENPSNPCNCINVTNGVLSSEKFLTQLNLILRSY
jgi:hypothetical protein